MRCHLLLVLTTTMFLGCSHPAAPAGPSEQINQSTPATTAVNPHVEAPFADCPSHPSLSILLNGRPLGPLDATGGGHYCGSIADGVALDLLPPIVVHPGAKVNLAYATDSRWDLVKFQVLQGDVVFNSGALVFETDTAEFPLPASPGKFTVSIQRESRWGREFTAFKTLIK